MEVENRLTFLSCLLNKRTQSIRKQNKVTIHYQLLNLLFRKKWHDHFCFFQYKVVRIHYLLAWRSPCFRLLPTSDLDNLNLVISVWSLFKSKSSKIQIYISKHLYVKLSKCDGSLFLYTT